MSVRNIVAVGFVQDSLAFEAFTRLQLMDAEQHIVLGEAAIVERGANGHVLVKDIAATTSETTSSMLEFILAILGHPLDVTTGRGNGALFCDPYKIGGTARVDSGLGAISSTVRCGQTAVLADVCEQSNAIIDRAMDGLGGQLKRLTSTDVEAEIAAVSPPRTSGRASILG